MDNTAQPSLGQFVGSLKAARDEVHDRAAFLERCRHKAETPTVAGLPMVGLGGSCGKPAFLLPFVVRFDEAKVARLEEVANRFGMFVEYGAYPHLKLEDGGQEIAAVQDWTNATLLFLRPSYHDKDALVTALVGALQDSSSENPAAKELHHANS
jgi:hypothetical protein